MEPTIRVANAPCSWGALEFDTDGVGEGAGFARVLDEMAATGYAGTELGDWGFMPTEPAALRRELDARGLAMVGAFVPAALADDAAHAPAVEAALRVARLLAAVGEAQGRETKPFVVLADDNCRDPERTRCAGRIRPGQGLTAPQWERFARGAERVARAVLEATGLRTVFHHHCAGFVETPDEIDALLRRTDPALVGLCLDTGHCAYGGGDPLGALRAQGDRVWHVHFKDCDPAVAAAARHEGLGYLEAVARGVFCELGRGQVDLSAVVAELRAHGYGGWVVVEQDVLPGMGTPRSSARRNREVLAGLGL
jgi:inosose dehydratase